MEKLQVHWELLFQALQALGRQILSKGGQGEQVLVRVTEAALGRNHQRRASWG